MKMTFYKNLILRFSENVNKNIFFSASGEKKQQLQIKGYYFSQKMLTQLFLQQSNLTQNDRICLYIAAERSGFVKPFNQDRNDKRSE